MRRERGDVELSLQSAPHDRKLVAPEPSHRVGLSHNSTKSLGHGHEQGVAQRVAEGVVDALELIEIEAKHGARFPERDATKRLLQTLAEQFAIWQAGQG